MAKHAQKKNVGPKSKKEIRRKAANARAAAWATLTDAQKIEVKERNKAAYDAARK